jgi:hypothetical protein
VHRDLKTREVYESVGINYSHLAALIRAGKVPRPEQRDISGDFSWSPNDVANVRAALAMPHRRGRPRKVVASGK